ncbi:MAG: phosphatidylserine decarboxylase family protein [Bacteroidales bacterium]|jgi:phosphatidylserine decarboxylase|nr:phosphatidylserine decarboxylase family protein [Bacteroidales bacterium]
MKIHKEGYGILAISFAIILAVYIIIFLLTGWCLFCKITLAVAVILLICIARFFRVPKRTALIDENLVISAADGKVVIIKETEENEFLKQKCIQVSVFMSLNNMHVNYFPVGGEIIYCKYHAGHYFMAYYPKASEKNERTSVAVRTDGGKVVFFRQIAGFIARRIVCYAKEGARINQCTQVGFIKFGSRVDLFLPMDSEIMVKVGDNVRACESVIAKLS